MIAAFENIVPCMFNYATDLSLVNAISDEIVKISVEGHDLSSLLYNYLDELLFRFCTDGFCCKYIKILELNKDPFRIIAHGYHKLQSELMLNEPDYDFFYLKML